MKNFIQIKCISAAAMAVFLCISLTACNSTKYQEASQHYENGNYTAALEIYEELGEYEDSAEKAVMCKYAVGESLYSEGEYSAALELYKAVGSYKDAEDKIRLCEKEIGMRENADYAFLADVENPSLVGWGPQYLLNLID